MNNPAETITSATRSQDDTAPVSLDEHCGTAYSTEALIHARWIWIAVPCAVVLGGIIQLASTVWRTNRAIVLAWRYGTLVPLLMTLSQDDEVDDKEEEVVFIRKTGAVQKGIRDRCVHLVQDRQGIWSFE